MRTLIEETKNEKGIAVLPYEEDQWFGFFDYMPAWFFRKFGFKGVDRDGSRLLLSSTSVEPILPTYSIPGSRLRRPKEVASLSFSGIANAPGLVGWPMWSEARSRPIPM